ncbi:MAG: M56 family metallopeptidase [Oscillospiraceae bacterium]|nr:M56 family metallopeptidase [Oscillospiraceae bacterium]
MLRDILTLSALILVVLLVRAIFKNRVPKRMIYALWLVVLLKLCLPGTLFSLPVLPAEKAATLVQSVELPAQTAPVIQQPAQTVTKPQTPAQQPVSPEQETVKPAAKPLTTAQILQIVWFSGSALLGLWLFGAWAVFTIRLHRDRRFVGKRGGTCIYVSDAVKSPCLAGLIPAVYLTEDVLQADEAELILRHELTHLRHLDFLWSLCRTAAVTVYWWNPFIWLAAICSKRDAELACDEAVAAKLPESKRLAYARAILAQAPRKTAALSLAGPPVKERILFLTKKQRTSAICIVLALALTVSATGCSFAELTRQKAGEITMPDHAADSSANATPQEADSALPVMDTVELIGFVADSQTPWIELYESTDSKEPLAKIPYDLIAALPGCDRKSEAFTFGFLDSTTFYYGEIGAFCWCVAALPPAAGTGAANVCTSPDSGETWEISDPNALYTGTVIGAGFASETVGFISYRYFFDNGPEIARTLDGGKTWTRLELDIPAEYAQYNMQPQNPTFSGNDGSYPIILLGKDGNDRTTTLQTHDGGMTWTWDSIQASDSNTLDLPEEAAAWVNTYLSAQYTVLDTQTFDFDGNNNILLLVGSENPSVTGYQVFALEQNDGAYVLYAWNESYGWDPSLEDMVCAMRTDTFAAVYGFTKGSDPAFDMLELTLDDGSEETVSIEPNTPFLHVIPGRLKEVQNITLSGSETNTKQNIGRGWNARPDSVEDTYPMNDSIWSRVHARLDCGHWVPEYEDGVWEFELEDSKRSDLPGDIFQWPRYYSAFVDYFSGMNADLSYLDQDSFWTKDLSEDGQTLIVTMTPGNGDHTALTLSYSRQTQKISSGDRLPAIMTLTIFDLSTAPSGEKTCTLSAEDAAVVETLFSIDSMTPTANDSESVCAYQFDIENRSYLLDDSLDYVDVVVRESEGDYTYYCKHLSDAEIESLREIIEVYAK